MSDEERERTRRLHIEADAVNREAKEVAQRLRLTIQAYEDRLRNERKVRSA